MTAIRSIKTARTEDRTAKPVFRGGRAIVAAAAVIAFGLLAAPLQADHVTYDATVTIELTDGQDGNVVELTVQSSPANTDPRQQTGLQYRTKVEGTEWSESSWGAIGDEVGDTATMSFWDFTVDGLWSFQARAWNMRQIDGEWHLTFSTPSEVLTWEVEQ